MGAMEEPLWVVERALRREVTVAAKVVFPEDSQSMEISSGGGRYLSLGCRRQLLGYVRIVVKIGIWLD